MKILIYNFEYPPLGGGGGVATQELAEELAKRHTVHVVTSWYPDLARHEVTAGVIIHRVWVPPREGLSTATLQSMFFYIFTAFWHGLTLLRQEKFDVINAQFVIPSGIPGALLARLFAIPFVVSFVGGDVYDPTKGMSPHRHWWLKVLIRIVARQATIGTAISQDIRQRAQNLHGLTLPIEVTHLGMVHHEVSIASRRELGLPERGPVVISIGRLIPRKGFDSLLIAWQAIQEGYLVIVGDGPLLHELKTMADSLGISDRVLFTGYVPDERKRQLLRAADMYVSSSHHEGFGLVFLEAMEAGLPIVAFAEGGHCDFLEQERNALLVTPGNQAALQTAIKRLLGDSALQKKMRDENSRQVINFYLEKTGPRFEAVLKRAYDASRT